MTSKQTMIRAAVLCSAVLLALAATRSLYAQSDTSLSRSNSQFLYAFRDATAEASKSTVRVLSNDKEIALGTIVSADGYIVTKDSLLPNGKPVFCKLPDGKTVQAKVIGIHEPFDLAMLKVDAKGLTPVTFTESKVAQVGSWLATAGPSDDPVLAVGVMGVAARSPKADPRDLRNSKRGFLGIIMDQTKEGVKIKEVSPGSAAWRADLKANDVILSVNGQAVPDMETVQKIMSKTRVGDEVTLKIKRGDAEKEVKATLGKAPLDRGDVQNRMGSELSERKTGFPTFFQHDTIIKPKDCGGPICDLDGHVLGINIARAGRTESYTIPTEALKPILAELKSGKLAPKTEIVSVDLEKKMSELKAAFKKAEEAKADAEKKLADAKGSLKKLEAEKADAEKELKKAQEALEKAEKELKEKK